MDDKVKRSEKMVSLYVMLFITLVFVALALNELVIKDMSADEYVNEVSVTKKGTQTVEEFTGYKKITYDWQYNLKKYSITLNLFNNTYNEYKKKDRIATRDWTYYSKNWNREENEANLLAKQLIYLSESKGFTELEKIEFISSFVQSLPSIEDTDDYPKFPYETLYEIGGDCEDLSILLSNILNEGKIANSIIEFPNHVGVGVDVKSEGAYYTKNSIDYYYVESTSPGYVPGDIFEEHIGWNAKIYENQKSNLIYPEFKINLVTKNDLKHYKVEFNLTNYGETSADIEFYSSIKDNESVLDQIRDYLEIGPLETINLEYNLTYLENKQKIRFEIKGEKINSASFETKWI